jgi:hypothetical protein
MSEYKLPLEGGCRCGQVRLRVTQPVMLTSACHCIGCQRMTSSAFSITVAVPSAGFEVTAGEPVLGGLHGPTRHFYCPHCKSWLFTRPEGFDQIVNVRASMLDDRAWFQPYVEVCTAEKMPWATTSAAHSFAQAPAPEVFLKLAQEFAQHVRPAKS